MVVDDKLSSMWRKAAIAYFKIQSQHPSLFCLMELGKATEGFSQSG
jgi:hypothetical protein